MKNARHGAKKFGSGRQIGKYIYLAVAVVIIAAVVAYLALQPGVTEIGSMKTVSLAANQTSYFGILGSVVALRFQGYSGTSATVYASQSPVLFGPVTLISLPVGSSANVSSSGSQTADMNIRLVSGSASGVTLVITPLPSSLGVKASSSAAVTNPTNFVTGTSAVTTATAGNAPASGSSSTTTAVTTATTTISQTASASQQALADANASSVGKELLGFKALYAAGKECNANNYNITYVAYYSSMPTGPESFYNVSAFTPTGLTASATELSATSFNVTYSTVSPSSATTGPAVSMIVNTATGSVASPAFSGIFRGFSTADLSDIYTFESGIPNGNPCAAYIAPP